MKHNSPIPPKPDGYTDEEWEDYNRDPCSWCIRELHNPSEDIRTNAADILRGLGADALDAIPALVESFSDPDDMFRGYCIHAVSDIALAIRIKTGTTTPSLINAIPHIVRLLEDRCDDVVCSAIVAIESIGTDAKSALNRLIQISETGTDQLRGFAESAITAISK